MESLHALAEAAARLLEYAGAAVILGGVVVATVWYVRCGLRDRAWGDAYTSYRANLGRGILLGLELLVGADIIATITAPLTFASVGLLAVIVAIRTLLSCSLETEIEGCGAWERRRLSDREAEGRR